MVAPHSTRDHSEPHVVVIGAGIAGLSSAWHLRQLLPAVRVSILEAGNRVGGIIRTERTDGFVIEHGPDVFLAGKPGGRELAEAVGLGDRFIEPLIRGAYIRHRGRLARLPAGMNGLLPATPRAALHAGMLSLPGRVRAALEPLVPRRRGAGDESLESFAVRRLGREAYDRLVEPLLSGIYAGDGSQLGLAATFPQLAAMEREHGSVMRAAQRRGPQGARFLAFRTGMEELPEALLRRLTTPDDSGAAVTVRLGAGVRGLAWRDGRVDVALGSGESVRADAIVLATPVTVTAALLRDVEAGAAAALAGIASTSTAMVSLGYRRASVPHALDATGYIVPRAERGAVLACTWSSAKLPGRAPAGHALLRVYLGGAGRERVLEQDDAALLALARGELRAVLGVTEAPALVRVARATGAMPQYVVGHAERIATVRHRLEKAPWLAVAGNAWRGVGIPDAIESGREAAERLSARLTSPAGRS